MSGAKILIVEDEGIVAMDIERHLSAMGYGLAGTVATGEEAVSSALSRRPDLVLMDIKLKGPMDGITAAEQISKGSRIPVVFLTAYSEEATLQRAKLAEPYGCVLKPFEDRDLRTTIELALHKHRADEEHRRLTLLYAVLGGLGQAFVRRSFSREDLLSEVCRVVVEAGAFRLAWVAGTDGQGGPVVPIARAADARGWPKETTFIAPAPPDDPGPAATAIREDTPYVCNDVAGQPFAAWRDLALQEDVQAVAAVPIRARGRVCSALGIGSSEPGFFGEAEVRLLQEVAQAASFALERIEDDAERRRAEEDVVRAKETWERTFDAVPDLLAVVDVDYRILRANTAMAERVGLTPQACAGLTCYQAVHGTDQPPLFCPHAKLLADGGRHVAEVHEERLRGDFSISVSPLFDAAGTLLGSVHVARDITERKRAEEAAARVAQAERLEAIGTLAGGIAHDFNNVLTAITGYVELTRMEIPRGSKAYEDLGQALLASNRAAELTTQILAFCRQRQREPQPVAPKLQVKEALKFLRATLPSTIEIRQTILSESVVLCDPSEIHRIVVNLCANAGLAMADQEGVLDVLLEDVELDGPVPERYPGLTAGRFVRLTVRDTGCGMTPEVKARIFEPFFTTRPEGQGTGMGLSAVHGIVTERGGAIAVESEPGKGTTFEVLLPVTVQKASVFDVSDAPLPTGTERILFVDDEEMTVKVFLRFFGKLGYRVRGFTSSREALETFEAEPQAFDLVVTDLTMPQMTGDVLASRVRLLRPDLPVILCTGYSKTMTTEKAAALGVVELLGKPLSPGRLSKAIRDALDRH